MPAPFTVVNQTTEATVFTVDGSGNTTQNGNATVTGTLVSGAQTQASSTVTGNETVGGTLTVTGATTLTGATTQTGLVTVNGGTATNGSAPVLTPTLASGTAAQLSDTTRDYMVYMDITTSGTATSIAIGPTSTPANTIVASASVTAGVLYSFRLPAGWYIKWSGTTTALSTTAIGC